MLLLFSYSCPHFLPITLLCPTHPTTFNPPPNPCLYPWALYICSLTWPFPFFLLLSPFPLWSLSVCFYFHVSSSILLVCLFFKLLLCYCSEHISTCLFEHRLRVFLSVYIRMRLLGLRFILNFSVASFLSRILMKLKL